MKLALSAFSLVGYHPEPWRSSAAGDRRSWKKGRLRVSVTIGQLAELVQGRVVGDPNLEITAAQPLTEARAGHITFVASDKYAAQLHSCAASAALVSESLATPRLTVIRVADPLAAFVTIVRHLHGHAEPPIHGIDPRPSVDPRAQAGEQPSIHPFASIR